VPDLGVVWDRCLSSSRAEAKVPEGGEQVEQAAGIPADTNTHIGLVRLKLQLEAGVGSVVTSVIGRRTRADGD
jgi:hypothetical protein